MKLYYLAMALCRLDGQMHYTKVTLNGVKALGDHPHSWALTAIGVRSGTAQAAIMVFVGAMAMSSDA